MHAETPASASLRVPFPQTFLKFPASEFSNISIQVRSMISNRILASETRLSSMCMCVKWATRNGRYQILANVKRYRKKHLFRGTRDPAITSTIRAFYSMSSTNTSYHVTLNFQCIFVHN